MSKCKCQKWAHMSHLDICRISYDKKKGWESNYQFDSRPLKVRNRPNFLACRQRATYHWKAMGKGYNFSLDLIAIRVMHMKLCALKVTRVLVVRISGLPPGVPWTKSHLNVALVESYKIYYMKEGGGFLRIQVVVNLLSLESPVTCPNTKSVPENELTNLLVG